MHFDSVGPKSAAMVLGFPLREPTNAELDWFNEHPAIAGYAADDFAIVLSPFANLSNAEFSCVAVNEGLRLLMRGLSLDPEIILTEAQLAHFADTAYASDMCALKQTVIARIASGDPSAGNVNDLQRGYATCLLQVATALAKRKSERDVNVA